MQRIIPNIWFDHNAAEAAEFYTSAFPGGRMLGTQHYPTEGLLDFQTELAGQVLTVDFELGGYRFTGFNAGPEFAVNPSISFMVNFDPATDRQASERLDALWTALAEGGQVLMPLQDYPFSPRYGWVADRYGVSWQLMLADGGAEALGGKRPFIVPSLLFGHTAQNRAQEAIEYYLSVFGGRLGTTAPYPEPTGPAQPGNLMYADFQLLDQWFAAMDSGVEQDFTFNCGVSLLVECADQAELDRYWNQLSAVPEAEQCGWCADKFGVAWQFIPANLGELMAKPDAYRKLMNMKKIEVSAFD